MSVLGHISGASALLFSLDVKFVNTFPKTTEFLKPLQEFKLVLLNPGTNDY
jgi:hypothetical protein